MIQKRMWVGVLLLLVSLPACILVVEDDHDFRDDDDLYGSQWRLNVVVYQGRSYTVPPGEPYTAYFDTRQRLQGRADCNDYDATYDLTYRGGIHIDELYSTDAFCGGNVLEELFFDALVRAREYEVHRDALTINSRGDDYVLYFYRD